MVGRFLFSFFFKLLLCFCNKPATFGDYSASLWDFRKVEVAQLPQWNSSSKIFQFFFGIFYLSQKFIRARLLKWYFFFKFKMVLKRWHMNIWSYFVINFLAEKICVFLDSWFANKTDFARKFNFLQKGKIRLPCFKILVAFFKNVVLQQKALQRNFFQVTMLNNSISK